ncbi:unnamed protein product [Pleuronectes platessa]|uniref:Uncharacterized protein n=1 Tax=Pleuronectes platessa TaxID=8262 RepID=A0A9N7V606_PLEPL|nr:unnamed protein product [Pleuronectes platessa]
MKRAVETQSPSESAFISADGSPPLVHRDPRAPTTCPTLMPRERRLTGQLVPPLMSPRQATAAANEGAPSARGRGVRGVVGESNSKTSAPHVKRQDSARDFSNTNPLQQIRTHRSDMPFNAREGYCIDNEMSDGDLHFVYRITR